MFTPNIVPILTFFDGSRWMIYWRNEDNVLGVTNLFDSVYEKNVSRDEKANILNVAKTLADKSWIDFMGAEGWQIAKADEFLAKVGVGTKRTLLLQRKEGERFCDSLAVELLIQRASWSPIKKKATETQPEVNFPSPGKGRRAAAHRRMLGLDDWGDEEEALNQEEAELTNQKPKESTPEPEKESPKASEEQNGQEEEKPSTSRAKQPKKHPTKRQRKPARRERNASSAEFMDEPSELSTPIKEKRVELPVKKTIKKKTTKRGDAADWSDKD